MLRPLSFLCFFLSSLHVFAIDEPRVIGQSTLLVDKINKEHVRPRAVDDAFGKQAHAYLMDFLDPNRSIFTAEDRTEFERLALSIDDDITGKKLTYFSAIARRFAQRLEVLKTQVSAFSEAPVPLKSSAKVSVAGLDRNPPEKEYAARWKQLLQIEVMENMIERLDDADRTFPEDSLKSYEIAARKKVSRHYTELCDELLSNPRLVEDTYLEALALTFDPHTLYFSPTAKKDFEEELTPDREMYGFSFGINVSAQVIITNVFPGSPAWLSNEIHEGDIVEQVQLGSGPVVDLTQGISTLSELSRMFDEAPGKTVKLVVTSEAGKQREVHLVKAKVYSDADVIKNAVLAGDKKIGYVSLPDFYVNWTDTSALGCANDLAKCLVKLKKESIQGLILDLRGNGGGSLREAVDLAGIFIDYGPILALKDEEGNVRILKDLNRGAIYNDPLIILVDEGSASASEIVAGALQDHNRALIVGRQSFGKATSQSVYPLDPKYTELSASFMEEDADLGYANITNGILYRITRKWNQKSGVTPDVVLPFRVGTEEPEVERTYANALEPDPIEKNIVFTPAAPLPVGQLQQHSASRLKDQPVFIAYTQLIQAFGELEARDTLIPLDLQARLAIRNHWMDLGAKVDAYAKELPTVFTPQSNAFDKAIYDVNEVLRQYQERFLERLKTDVELLETYWIMKDLIDAR